jgi:hypothetical protein
MLIRFRECCEVSVAILQPRKPDARWGDHKQQKEVGAKLTLKMFQVQWVP